MEIRKACYYVPLELTGVDDQGRQTCRCPQCGGPAYIEPDGRVICHDWAPIQAYLEEALRKLMDET